MAGNDVDVRCSCDDEKLITILSIDGGGVRGIIPGKILEFLESELKKLDGNDVSIFQYFDMISGTSTGGLVAAMLATPKPSPPGSKEPIIAAKDICDFYLEEAPKIFGPGEMEDKYEDDDDDKHASLLSDSPSFEGPIDFLNGFFKRLWKPKYKGNYLHQLIKDKLGNRKLKETLTNVLITGFDIKLMQPTIFSTFRGKDKEIDNTLMSDVCISTSAAPTYFPPYYFENQAKNNKKEFNMVDGGVAANNPTLLGIGEAATRVSKIERTDKQVKFLVLSLGTGEIEIQPIGVKDRKWGILDWCFTKWWKPTSGSCPILDAFSNASDHMVDIYTSMYLQDKISEDNFLRIQYENLPSAQAALDDASPKNLQNLVKLGEELLTRPVVSVDLETSEYIQADITNKEALIKFAKKLSENRHGLK